MQLSKLPIPLLIKFQTGIMTNPTRSAMATSSLFYEIQHLNFHSFNLFHWSFLKNMSSQTSILKIKKENDPLLNYIFQRLPIKAIYAPKEKLRCDCIIIGFKIMAEEISEYEQFRLKRLRGGFDEDNTSAHFSLKDSNHNFTDRVEVNSSRSIPHEIGQSLERQLLAEKNMYSDLSNKHQELNERYRQLELRYEQTKEQLIASQKEANKLRQTLLIRKELELATKKKLKEWVFEAKKGLDQ